MRLKSSDSNGAGGSAQVFTEDLYRVLNEIVVYRVLQYTIKHMRRLVAKYTTIHKNLEDTQIHKNNKLNTRRGD